MPIEGSEGFLVTGRQDEGGIFTAKNVFQAILHTGVAILPVNEAFFAGQKFQGLKKCP